MGFKRTPEGRVFFQGADQIANKGPSSRENDAERPSPASANDAPPRPKDRVPASQQLLRNDTRGEQTQTQIVSLLKSLNERLKITQAERDKMMHELQKYRLLIEDLEDKSARNERLTLDLEHQLQQSKKEPGAPDAKVLEAEKIARATLKELQQTRKYLAEMEEKQRQQTEALADKLTKSGSNYAALSRRIKDTETRQTEMDEKVDEAITQQAKLLRKVDKAIEDRVRFMRKIERIEETVIQTRDSLNAKAMVLLTEQGAAAQSDYNEIDVKNPETLAAIKQGQDKHTPHAPEQSNAHKVQTAIAVAAMLIIGVSAGLLWNVLQNRSAQTPLNAAQISQTSEWENVDIEPQETSALETPPEAPLNEPAPVTSMDWAIEDTIAEAAPETEEENIAQALQQEETVIEDEEPVQEAASVEEAAEQEDTSNDLGAIDVQDEEQLIALLEDNPQKLAEELNAIEPQNTPRAAVESVTTAPVESLPTKTEQELRSLINPDSGLPNAVKAIEEQAFKGMYEAQHDLAAIYTAGHGGVQQDYKRAGFWFERAAEGGIANASYNLGVLHHQGLGFESNIDEAMRWYGRAAAQGHPEAQYNLGIAYIEGIGVTYDPVKASQYFTNAARGGIMEAAYNLGLIYENGLLGNTKPEEALVWYKAAADQGSPEARQALEALAKTLGIDVEDVNRVIEEAKPTDISGATRGADKESNAVSPVIITKDLANAPENFQTNPALIAQIQDYLMRSGLYPGPADGVGGALTEDAIRAYQAQNNLKTDGLPSQSLLGHMLSNGDEGQGSRYN